MANPLDYTIQDPTALRYALLADEGKGLKQGGFVRHFDTGGLASLDNDQPPEGQHYEYSGDPSGSWVRFLVPNSAASTEPGEQPQTQSPLSTFGQATASALDNTVGALIPYATQMAAHLGLRTEDVLAQLGSSIFGGDYQANPERMTELANQAGSFMGQPFGKAFGVTETPGYKGETTGKVMEFIGENLDKGSDYLSSATGLPKGDVMWIANALLPKAIGTVGEIGATAAKNAVPFAKDVAQTAAGMYERGEIPGMISPNMYAVKPKGKGTWLQDLADVETEYPNAGLTQAVKQIENSLNPASITYDWLDSNHREIVRQFHDFISEHEHDSGKVVTYNDPEFLDIATKFASKKNEEIKAHNQAHPENPQTLITMPEDFKTAREAELAWLKGPGSTYITRQMGTGIQSDPLLQDIERNQWNFMGRQKMIDDFGEGATSRQNAQAIHMADPNFDINKSDIGGITANTEPGAAYENATDQIINVTNPNSLTTFNSPGTLRSLYGIDTSLPDNKLSRMPVTAPIYDFDLSSSNSPIPLLTAKLREEVLAGRIKPENINNVSAQRLANLFWEDEKKRIKDLQSDTKAYENYKLKSKDSLPGTSFDDGSKMVLFTPEEANKNPAQFIRDISVDTKDLDHCVAHSGHATGNPSYKGRYQPLVEPHTGKPPANARNPFDPREGETFGQTQYTLKVLDNESSLASLRDPQGNAQATIELENTDSGKKHITQIMGLKDGPIDSAYWPHIKQWLNEHSDEILPIRNVNTLDHIGNLIDTQEPTDLAHRLISENPQISNKKVDELVKYIEQQENDPNISREDAISRQIGRFISSDDVLQYAREHGLSLEHQLVDIPTATMEDLQEQGEVLRRIRSSLIDKYDSEHPDKRAPIKDQITKLIDIIKNTTDEIKSRIQKIKDEQDSQFREFKNQLVPEDTHIPPLITEVRQSIWDTFDRHYNHLHDVAPRETKQIFSTLKGEFNSPADAAINKNLVKQLLSYTFDAKSAADIAYDVITRDYPFMDITPGQAQKALNVIKNWTEYRAKNEDPFFQAQEEQHAHAAQQQRPTLKLFTPDVDLDAHVLPNLNVGRAHHLRDIMNEFFDTGVQTNIPADDEGFVSALSGDVGPHAILPRDAHQTIINVLTSRLSRFSTYEQLVNMIESQDRPPFSQLTDRQKSNAMNIVFDWLNVHGINHDMRYERP